MAIQNRTGALNSETWDFDVDEYHVTGSITVNGGQTITVTGNANPLVFDGNFNLDTATGTITMVGTSTARKRIQISTTPTGWDVSAANFRVRHTSTGTFTLAYTDSYGGSIQATGSGGASTYSNCRIHFGHSADSGWRNTASGGTHTWTDLEVYNYRGTSSPINISPTGGTFVGTRMMAMGAKNVVNIGPTGGTTTINGLKAAYCGAALGGACITLGGTAVCNITDMLAYGGGVSGVLADTSTVTRMIVSEVYASGWFGTVAAAKSFNLTEPYIGGDNNNTAAIRNDGTGTLNVNGGVVSQPHYGTVSGSGGIFGAASVNCDIVMFHAGKALRGGTIGTSDNDYLAGSANGFIGVVPGGADSGQVRDWLDANLILTVDTDSGNTTSTSTPGQYENLAANRTNARATPNKPLTITGVTVSGITQTGASVSFTTGIRARSRVLLSTLSGFDPVAPANATPWKYHGFLDPFLMDFTLPTTTHSTTLANLASGVTYYMRVECYDPCGRRFVSGESSFATLPSAGAGDTYSGTVREDVRNT